MLTMTGMGMGMGMGMRMVDEPSRYMNRLSNEGFKGFDLDITLMSSYADFRWNLRRKKVCCTVWQTPFQVNDKYVPVKPIGNGASGAVCSAIDTETKEMVAIKKIINVFANRVKALRVLREILIMRHLSHENVIALKDVMVGNSSLHSGVEDSMDYFEDVYMVLELMDTDLSRIINCSRPISNNVCKIYLFQLLKGLQYLHSVNILHRDLKPGNVLVNSKGELKICDFGLARFTAGNTQFKAEYVVTRWYRAPELLLGCDKYCGPSIDVWSVGCIFAEILGRKPIFPGQNSLSQLKLIISVLGTQPESNLGFIENVGAGLLMNSLPYTRGTHLAYKYPQADPLAIDLLQKMLAFDPAKRINATQALQHPYLAELYDPLRDSPAPFPLDLDINENMEDRIIRESIWTEVLLYHPEEASG